MGTFGPATTEALSDNIAAAFPLTAGSASPDQQSVSTRASFDQATVEDMLREQMKASQGWNSANEVAYQGLPPGTPLIIGIFAKIAEQFTGIPASTWVTQWLENPVVDAIGDIIADAQAKIFRVSAQLQSIFSNLDFTSEDFDPSQALSLWINDVVLATRLLLGIDSPLPASNLYGSPPTSVFDLIPAGSLGSANTNYVSRPFFISPDEIEGSDEWFWDVKQFGNRGGSVKITADGEQHALYSNRIGVAPGQVLTVSVKSSWEDIAGTGTPIRLMLAEYATDENGVLVELTDANGEPALQSLVELDTSATDSEWVQLTGNYTVPSPGPTTRIVEAVSLVVEIGDTLTAGDVWFTYGLIMKTPGQSLIPQHMIDGLADGFAQATAFSQQLIDSLVNNLLGLVGVDHDPDRVAEAVKANVDTVVGTSAQMVQILAALGPGNPDADDFERFSLFNLGSNWNVYQTGLGTLATFNAHDAEWSGISDAEFVAYRNNVSAQGNIQKATIVLSTVPMSSPFWAPSEFGSNDIWLRCTSFVSWATRTGLRLRFTADNTVHLHWVLNGVETLLFEDDLTVGMSTGAVLEFWAGLPGEPMRMAGWLNNKPVLPTDFEDSDGISTYGTSQLRRGFGGKMNTGLFTGIAGPGGVKQWTGQG